MPARCCLLLPLLLILALPGLETLPSSFEDQLPPPHSLGLPCLPYILQVSRINRLLKLLAKKRTMSDHSTFFAIRGKRSDYLKPNSIFSAIQGKRNKKPNSLYASYGKRPTGLKPNSLKPNSLFSAISGKRNLRLDSLFVSLDQRGRGGTKPNAQSVSFNKRSMKPNGLFGPRAQRSFKPNDLFWAGKMFAKISFLRCPSSEPCGPRHGCHQFF